MIDEIYELKKQLDFEHEIILQMVRPDYQTRIRKDDVLKKVDSWILKVIRPNGEICIINVEYVMIAYIGKKMEW